VQILADFLVVRGSLILNSGFRAEGEVRLPGAHIGADLNCSGGSFSESEADPLGANMPHRTAVATRINSDRDADRSRDGGGDRKRSQ
jgi:hypothetical protein